MQEQLNRLECKLDAITGLLEGFLRIGRPHTGTVCTKEALYDLIAREQQVPATRMYRLFRGRVDYNAAIEGLLAEGKITKSLEVRPGPGRRTVIYSVTHSPAVSVGGDCATANNA